MFGPLVADLWREADEIAGEPDRPGAVVAAARERVQEALARLAASPSAA